MVCSRHLRRSSTISRRAAVKASSAAGCDIGGSLCLRDAGGKRLGRVCCFEVDGTREGEEQEVALENREVLLRVRGLIIGREGESGQRLLTSWPSEAAALSQMDGEADEAGDMVGACGSVRPLPRALLNTNRSTLLDLCPHGAHVAV